MNTFSWLGGEISLSMVNPLAPETKHYCSLSRLAGETSLMKGQTILPRLNDFPGETGKCRGNFLHVNRSSGRLVGKNLSRNI